MNKQQWIERVEEFCAEIDGDEDLGDVDYLEVMDELEGRAATSAGAKREEMKREEGA